MYMEDAERAETNKKKISFTSSLGGIVVFVLKICQLLVNFEYKIDHDSKYNDSEDLFFIGFSTVRIFHVYMVTSEGRGTIKQTTF